MRLIGLSIVKVGDREMHPNKHFNTAGRYGGSCYPAGQWGDPVSMAVIRPIGPDINNAQFYVHVGQ